MARRIHALKPKETTTAPGRIDHPTKTRPEGSETTIVAVELACGFIGETPTSSGL